MFGGTVGECIVLELPSGEWGVVDCYAPRVADPLRDHPILAFLTQRGVKELRFLCLTHPHEDHYLGLSHLLQHLVVREFWRYDGCPPKQLCAYLRGSAASGDEREATADLRRTFELVGQAIRQPGAARMVVRRLTGYQQVYAADAPVAVRIHTLSPSGTDVERCDSLLGQCFDANETLLADLPVLDVNPLSAVLRVQVGSSTLILGSDLECEGWAQVLGAPWCDAELLAASAVKASHHGSSNGYCPGLWKAFAASGRPWVLLSRYHSELPARVALEHFALHAEDALITCWGQPTDDDAWVDASPGARSVLSLTALSALRRGASPMGRFSLTVDARGRVVGEPEVVPPASRLALQRCVGPVA